MKNNLLYLHRDESHGVREAHTDCDIDKGHEDIVFADLLISFI